MGRTDFSDQFRKIIIRHKRIGYDLNVLRQSACLVINPNTVDNFDTLFNCTPVDRASDSMMAPTKTYSCHLVGSTGAQLMISFASDFQCCLLADLGSPSVTQHIVSVESSSLLHHSNKT